ncbi:hypothetical protein GCM10029976_057620 [Kribbella albertanoniae]|uniref:Uncharacterized protein n=1 Tax=Kribbella albertanoniae TaxID=1266829 RepID=A0A4R4P382_9ACTN|nr:hypothetical protein [Kribbella albertanoniae]TDC15193.1 hypothetical protein E1261_40775 [Kribbella albertanoniae]
MGKAEREARRDVRGGDKAIHLMEVHNKVVQRLEKNGQTAAAENIKNRGGRWDSPDLRAERDR